MRAASANTDEAPHLPPCERTCGKKGSGDRKCHSIRCREAIIDTTLLALIWGILAAQARLPKQLQKMAPVASKPAPKKAVAPQPKKTQSTAKKGIDAALDGLE